MKSNGCEWGLVDFRRAAPRRLVDSLRAAVRRGQAVRAERRRRRDPRRLAGHQHHEPVERLPAESERRTGSREPGPWQISDRIPCTGQDPNDGAEDDSTVVQHRGLRAAAGTANTATPCGTASYGPGIFNFDTSILRNFTLGGSKTLQFRLEAFNTFNQPVWNDPNTAVTSRINTGRSPPRASRCASCRLA